jgi:hypothetical protein
MNAADNTADMQEYQRGVLWQKEGEDEERDKNAGQDV